MSSLLRRNFTILSAAASVAILLICVCFNQSPGARAFNQEPSILVSGSYTQTNLVSDLPGVAFVEDRRLLNPWGMAVNSSSPFWVVDNKSDRATLYKGDVAGSPLAPNASMSTVGIPNTPTFVAAPSQPTGVVANTTNSFPVSITPTSPAAPAQFIFVTLSGGINAWQPAFGNTAIVVRFMSGRNYTGVTIANNGSANLLYAVDFANGNIEVFDTNFNQTTVSGNFTDATIPAAFRPYNIQNLGGALYVTYARAFSFGDGNFGFVRKFDANGVRDTNFAIDNNALTDPWGLALAPANFGAFSNQLLVGNSRSRGIHDASINAFNPTTGALVGNMVDGGGSALEIPNLRAIVFGNGTNAGDTNTLYFTSDPSSLHGTQFHGLLGSLKPLSTLPVTTIQFSSTEYRTTEGAKHFDVTVTRSGDVSGPSTVNYATMDSAATQKSDYEITLGTLKFNPGVTSTSFTVLIVDNNTIGGGSSRDLDLLLTNATGAALVSPARAKLFIMDDEFDTPKQPANIIDDTLFFVRQHYFDFLNREPDQPGFDFWTNQINSCGNDQNCIELKRINVSAAFFLSIEFQRTGILAYNTEKAAFGGLPRYGQFMRDVQALQNHYAFGVVGADAQLEANKQAFFDEFVTRPEFKAKYDSLSNQNFVFTLFANAELNTTTAELYIAQLDGSQQVPPNGSNAKALAVVRQATDNQRILVSLYPNGLTSNETAAHLHGPAAAGVNGPIIASLPLGEVVDFQIPVTSGQLLDLSRGLFYFDVHTTNFPDGEIRGQLPHNLFVTDMLIRSLDAGIITRAQAVRMIAESDYFTQQEKNRAFVLMEYFGYLRRNPDDAPDFNLGGYNFWLNKLNEFNGNFVKSDMVKSFLISSEYRGRFGP